MAVVGTVEAKFTADISDLQSKLDTVVSKMNKTTEASGNMTQSVFTGVAAWDILKNAVSKVTDFLGECITVSGEEAATMAQVRNNIDNAGFSFDELAPKIEAVGKANQMLGFKDDETKLSLSKLIQTTGDYEQSLQLNSLAMDLSRAKHIDLESATIVVQRAMVGNTKALTEMGIKLGSAATTAEILNAMQQRVTGSAQAFVGSGIGGGMAAMTAQWDEMQREIGDSLAPTLMELFGMIQKNMPLIQASVTTLAGAITAAIPIVKELAVAFGIYFAVIKSVAAYTAITAAINGITVASIAAGGAVNGLTAAIAANPIGAIAVSLAIAGGLIFKTYNDLRTAESALADTQKKGVEQNQKLVDAYNKVHQSSQITIADLTAIGSDGRINMALLAEAAKNLAAESGPLATNFDNIGNKVLSAGKAMEAAAKEMEAAKMKMYDFNKQLTKLAEDHSFAIKKIQQQAKELTETFNEENKKQADEQDESIASVVQSHLDKQAQIKKDLIAATAFGQEIDEAKISELQAELAEENAFLSKHAEDVKKVSRILAKDEIEKIKEKAAQEQTARESDYKKKLVDLVQQLAKEQAAYKTSLTDLGIQFKDQFDSIRTYIEKTASPQIVGAFKDMVALANVELAKIGLPAIGGGGAGISGSSYTPTGIPNAVVNKVTANSGWPGAKNSFTQPTNSSKANITPTFNVNFYGNQNFSTPSQQNGLVDQIRKTMMSDFEKAKMGIY